MLTREDNELLTRVGPGTAMGNLFRQYWMPALPSSQLPTPDCSPVKVRLLGEDLVAFRDSEGRVGMLTQACPHRGASMFFGRNEENGLRCVYHGWKFNLSGACVDMPNEPVESNFKHKIQATAYPCQDMNGMVWVYLGPRSEPPPLPDLEFTTTSPEYCFNPRMVMQENNWMQGLEGDLDSSHVDYLHGRLTAEGGRAAGHWSYDKRPTLETISTDYGAMYAARRKLDEQGNYLYRITQFLLPFYAMVPPTSDDLVSTIAWLPVDDQHTVRVALPVNIYKPVPPEHKGGYRSLDSVGGFAPATSDPLTRWRLNANRENNYLLDYEAQRTRQFTGIPYVGSLQDVAITESMGPICDRTKDHLGTADSTIILVRRKFINAAKALRDHGIVPASVDHPELYRVRSAAVVLREGESWAETTNKSRSSDAGVPLAFVVPD